MPNTETKRSKPIHEVKVGMVKAAIWANDTPKGTLYSVTFTRLYKADEGWKTTQSFNPRDLADVVRVSVLAEAWLADQHREAREAVA